MSDEEKIIADVNSSMAMEDMTVSDSPKGARAGLTSAENAGSPFSPNSIISASTKVPSSSATAPS